MKITCPAKVGLKGTHVSLKNLASAKFESEARLADQHTYYCFSRYEQAGNFNKASGSMNDFSLNQCGLVGGESH